jgi:ABC-type multidrug transport system fused ATPase/permease subunit
MYALGLVRLVHALLCLPACVSSLGAALSCAAYPTRPDAPVLRSLSLAVAPGEMVAVVGSSGGGKSTLLALLTALYSPNSGTVRFDGHPVHATEGGAEQQLDTVWLRDQIGVVAQEPVIFGGTIRENISYGCGRGEPPSEEQVMAAASAANAFDFVNALPEGFDTVVGERGVTLSGGQRQRVAIARAIVNSPAVLLLDEATSALDSESERAVQEALETVVEQRTTLVIAHRLSTVMNADRIAVLDGGKVVEVGTPSQLRQDKDSRFSRLLKAQELR